ncbi:replication factor A protein 3 [Halteromyces radiatus]|uniref:replication factor A protein 3 n=1 Tax=Halteromyces radiatus TaxID=101107 RepID=UPI00221F7ACA|nr:replication factor A protein 3 [Halteromyces radiatus]KAI8097745.1 replication factor A protein 3 [Halteromyces radiatus]
MEKPTPRINSQLREKYVGSTVRIAGKVVSFSGDTAVMNATDGGQVLVKLTKESQWGTQYVEVIGRIEKDFSVMEFKSCNLGDNFGKRK